MNNKQLLPLIAKLGLFGGIIWVVSTIFSDNDAEIKPASDPLKTQPENQRKPAENSRKEAEITLEIPVFRPIPAEIFSKSTIPPTSVIIPTKQASTKLEIPTTVPVKVDAIYQQTLAPTNSPLPIKKTFVTREHLAEIFRCGAHSLSRPAAVEALKRFGIGKSAAYEALLEDGRFSVWLRFASDGIISWRK